MSKNKGGANYGIQARNVTAGAIAVGEGATATQNTVGSSADMAMLADGVAALRAAMAASSLSPGARDMLEKDVAAIQAEAEKPAPDKATMESSMQRLASNVKMIGEMASGAANMVEPLTKIATAVGLGASVLASLF